MTRPLLPRTKITGSDGIVTWTITEKIECLYARFVPIEYEIEYETNQGEFFESEPIYFDAENPITTNDIPELKRFGYVFDGWMYEESEFETTYGIYEDIILEANWIGTQIPYTTSTITSEVAIIDLSGIIKRGAYNYTIASNVKSVTFIGLEEKQYEMRIIVSIRSNPLIIGLENMHFAPTGGYGYDAISSKGTGEIYLYYKGTNSIQGGSGANGTNYYTQYSQATGNKNGIDGSKGGNGQNGGYGIRANKVHLVAYDEERRLFENK